MYSTHNTRETIWTQIEQDWDMVIVGGGITGAGILREAARAGLRVLMVEQRDFAWGTSSRSSKMVHGGLRYLAQGQLGLMQVSVRERQELLEAGPGLIDPLGFLIAQYKGESSHLKYQAGLTIYDLMALQWTHRQYSAEDFQMLAPHVAKEGLVGGFRFGDAQTDDARLVLRVISEALAAGGVALNYVSAKEIIREGEQVIGLRVRDEVNGREANAFAKVVVNATGAWADQLREQIGGAAKMRPLRGSHLIFEAWRFPVAQAVSFSHPLDKRPVFAFPWEGVTVVGTTDIDHETPLNDEPRISSHEVSYLMAAVDYQFPALRLSLDDVIASYAGVRPVIGTGKSDPSKESRDHVVWDENGLLTVTGGKLTTFRVIALDALEAARSHLPEMQLPAEKTPALNAVSTDLPPLAQKLDEKTRQRLIGRYGAYASDVILAAQNDELAHIPSTPTLWAELRWAARCEGVVHLDDLLLRRTRLGLLVKQGAQDLLQHIREICQTELGWDDANWDAETVRYLHLWRESYSLPARETIADWQGQLADIQTKREQLAPVRAQKRRRMRIALAVGIGMLVLLPRLRRRLVEQVSS